MCPLTCDAANTRWWGPILFHNRMNSGQFVFGLFAVMLISRCELLKDITNVLQIVKDVEKAILGSPLRLNPITEGQILRVPIPKCDTLPST
jgi:hypothetical protein